MIWFDRLLPASVLALAAGAAALVALMFQSHSRIEFETHYFNSWAMHKGSLEITQFIQRLSLYAHRLDGVTRDEVQLRYEIVVNRLGVVGSGSMGAFMDAEPERAALIRDLVETIREVEPMMQHIDDPSTAKAVIARVVPFETRFAELAAETYASDATRNSEFWENSHRLRQHFLIVAFALALSALVLAWKTIRQQRRIGEANEQLRVLAEHSAASAAEFQDAIASLSDGLILWDGDDRVSTWNARCEEILPYAKSVLRHGLSFANYVQQATAVNHPQWSDAARAQRVSERLSQHARRAGKGEFVTLDGRIIEVRESPTSNGGCVSVFRDITAERRLLGQLTRNEAELQRALAAEREINAQQRQFVSMASHEFKTPLAIIDSASQRLLSPGGDLPKRVDRIRSAVARMIQIIDRTLSTAQLDEGRVEFAPQRCDLRAILDDVCERQRTIGQRLTIALDMPPGDLSIDADPRLIDQVFTNLVSNAVKYSGSASRVDVQVHAAHDTLGVSVRDRGLGIPENELDRLFTRFFRASTTLTIPGTGIGLHLVKQFVSLHGGEVGVTSEVGKGSTFTVRLPRRQPAADERRAVA